MIVYSTLGTNEMDRSTGFYDAVLGAVDASGERTKVCLTSPFDRERATHGNGTMLASEAPSHEALNAFHASGLAQRECVFIQVAFTAGETRQRQPTCS